MLTRAALALCLLATPAWGADLRVIDGDSIVLGEERIRIENIDAPEIHGKCDAERRLAAVAKAELAELLSGDQMEIARSGRDRWGRTLATVSVGGRDVGEALVARGMAREWTGRRMPWCEEE